MQVTFDLGAVLSVTTDKLLCPLGDLYGILNYLTGDSLYTHQLRRAADACRPHVLQQYPELDDVDTSGVTPENWQEFLDGQKQRFGDAVPLAPLPEWEHKDPVDEAVELAGEDKVMVMTDGWPVPERAKGE